MTSMDRWWKELCLQQLSVKKIVELYIHLSEKHEHWNTTCVISYPPHTWLNIRNAMLMWRLEKEGEYFQQNEIYDKKNSWNYSNVSQENWTLKYNMLSHNLTEMKKKLMIWQLRGVITAWKKFWSYSKVSSEKLVNKIQLLYFSIS